MRLSVLRPCPSPDIVDSSDHLLLTFRALSPHDSTQDLRYIRLTPLQMVPIDLRQGMPIAEPSHRTLRAISFVAFAALSSGRRTLLT